MFDFKGSIKKGKEKAIIVNENKKLVDDVFDSLNAQLAEETKEGVSLKKDVTVIPAFFKNILISQGRDPEQEIVRGELNIYIDNKDFIKIGHWEQHPDGFPFTIEYLKERTDCWDQQALVKALSGIVSSGQFWLKVKELRDTPPF